MKPRILTSILMFISAYSPLFLIFAIRDFDFDKTLRLRHPIIICVMLILSIVCIAVMLLILNKIKRGNMAVKILSIKNRSVDLINYSILYVICFFGIDLSKKADVISMAVFLLLMLVLTITTKSIFLNPILSLANYSLYDLEYEYDGKIRTTVILSKLDIDINKYYYIRALSKFLYLVKEKKAENL